jgi:hypothetical protein
MPSYALFRDGEWVTVTREEWFEYHPDVDVADILSHRTADRKHVDPWDERS